MRRRTFTFDLFGPIRAAYYILLIVGVIPLSGATVGAGFLLAECKLSFPYER